MKFAAQAFFTDMMLNLKRMVKVLVSVRFTTRLEVA
jgi:hypothetical protein